MNSYQNIDWDAEAKRVAWAFGVTPTCRFVENIENSEQLEPEALAGQPIYRELVWQNGEASTGLEGNNAARFSCQYNLRKGRTYSIDVPAWRSKKISRLTDINLHWRGYIHSRIRDTDHALFLAKGLFFLDMLTPQVEAKLGKKIIIAQRHKAEWALELKGILTCDSMDWKAESKRIARAFDLPKSVEFETSLYANRTMGNLRSNVFREDLALHVNYSTSGQRFTVQTTKLDYSRLPIAPRGPETLAVIGIGWNGTPASYPITTQGDVLAKPLFRLGLLTPEVEAALRITVSAHQKVEWTLEFERLMQR